MAWDAQEEREGLKNLRRGNTYTMYRFGNYLPDLGSRVATRTLVKRDARVRAGVQRWQPGASGQQPARWASCLGIWGLQSEPVLHMHLYTSINLL